jgi:lauroyl/myristoyl acyltransferase
LATKKFAIVPVTAVRWRLKRFSTSIFPPVEDDLKADLMESRKLMQQMSKKSGEDASRHLPQ